MEVRIKATKHGLSQLFDLQVVCKLIRVDPYKYHMVDDTEVFTITEVDLYDAGIIK